MNTPSGRNVLLIDGALARMLNACPAACHFLCCEMASIDTHPIHLASWIMRIDHHEFAEVVGQIRQLKQRASSARKFVFIDIILAWTPADCRAYFEELERRLHWAIEIVRRTEALGCLRPEDY